MIPLRDDNPVRATPFVTFGLIALCVLVFVWQLTLSPYAAEAAVYLYGFLPGALEQYIGKGGTWVLPRYLNVQVLSYNKDIFKAAGLPEPKAGWTWTDLLGNAEQLGKKSGSKVDTYGYLDSSGGFLPLISLLQDQKIDLLNTPAQQVKLDGPEVLAAVKRLRTLFQAYRVLDVPQRLIDCQQLRAFVGNVDCRNMAAGPDRVEQIQFVAHIGELRRVGNAAGLDFQDSDLVEQLTIRNRGLDQAHVVAPARKVR